MSSRARISSSALSKQPVFAVRRDAALDDAYYRESLPIVEERLAQAGVRLGALLDSIFDPGARVQ